MVTRSPSPSRARSSTPAAAPSCTSSARLKLDHAQEMLVVSDHIDLPTGKVRIRRKGGGGGQKGIADIIAKTEHRRVPARAHRHRPPGRRRRTIVGTG